MASKTIMTWPLPVSFVLAMLLAVAILAQKSTLAIAALGSFGLVVLLLARPAIILYLFVFLIALYPKLPMITIHGYYVPIRLEDFSVLLFVVTVLLRRAIFPAPPLPMAFLKWILLFLAECFVSTSWGIVRLETLGTRTGFLYFARLIEYFSVFLISASELRSFAQLLNLTKTLVVSTFAVGVYGILQEFGIVPIYNAMHQTGEIVVKQYIAGGFGSDRLFSTFAGPYDLGAFYVIVAPILLLLGLDTGRSRFSRVCYLSVFALSMFCLYLTDARAPAVGAVVGLGVAMWLKGWRKAAPLIPPLAFAPALLVQGFSQRLNYFIAQGTYDVSFRTRLKVSWLRAWEAFNRSPIVGTGLGSVSRRGVGIDGMYPLLLAMVGVVGTLMFLFIIYRILVFLYGQFKEAQHATTRCLAGGLFSATVGLLLNAVFADIFFSSKIAEIYWFLIGSVFAADWLNKKRKAAKASRAGALARVSQPSLAVGAARVAS